MSLSKAKLTGLTARIDLVDVGTYQPSCFCRFLGLHGLDIPVDESGKTRGPDFITDMGDCIHCSMYLFVP